MARKRVVAYVCVSSSRKARIHSYEFQDQYWRGKFNGDPDNELVHIYADRGISGCSAYKRPEFMKMLQDACAGQFDAIYTKSVSRFVRNTVELLETVRELRDIGVEVEQISTLQPTSELFLTIAATIAENDLEVDSKRQKWSIQHRFENGWYSIGSRYVRFPYDSKQYCGYRAGAGRSGALCTFPATVALSSRRLSTKQGSQMAKETHGDQIIYSSS